MDLLSLIFLALGLAMDAFAVSVALGLKIPVKDKWKIALKAGLFFGIAQGVMPLIGWILGNGFSSYIEKFDHWIAFILLSIIGGKMIYEAIHPDEDEDDEADTSMKRMFILAIATSIDALAVGVTVSLLDANIWLAITLIGVITFILSFIGSIIGAKIGSKFEKKAELVGGVVLVLLALKFLIEAII
jgi:putative Mn2+ efflux pump MntP